MVSEFQPNQMDTGAQSDQMNKLPPQPTTPTNEVSNQSQMNQEDNNTKNDKCKTKCDEENPKNGFLDNILKFFGLGKSTENKTLGGRKRKSKKSKK